jgi:hypothetical protein
MNSNIPQICNSLLSYNFEIDSPMVNHTIDIDNNKLYGIQGCVKNQTNSIILQYADDETDENVHEESVGYKVIYSLIEIDVVPFVSVFIPYEALGILPNMIERLSLPINTNNYVFNYETDIFKCFKQLLYSSDSNIRKYSDDEEKDIKDNYVLVFIFTGNTRFLDETDYIHLANSAFVKLVPKSNKRKEITATSITVLTNKKKRGGKQYKKSIKNKRSKSKSIKNKRSKSKSIKNKRVKK